MNKKRLKIALAVLDAVKSKFPETQEFIENTLREECEKEKMTADEVIFLLLNLKKKKKKKKIKKKKISLDKHISFRFDTIVIIFLFIDVERCGR